MNRLKKIIAVVLVCLCIVPAEFAQTTIGPTVGTLIATKGNPVVDLAAVNIKVCTGSDDTAAINSAMALAGSMHAPPLMTYVGATHNKRQGLVRFPSNSTCNISSTIIVPPGVYVDLNNSTVVQTSNSQDAFDFAYDYLGGYGYGMFWSGMRNGFIQGPGSSSSTGRGIFLNVASFANFENIQIQGFKFGLTAWEVQYSRFTHIYATNNKVGFYITARPTGTSLTSIDLTFDDIVADMNDVYGIWCQECSDMKFTRVDASRNLITDIIIGSQLNNYLKTYTVNSGGSGYALNAKIPVTITDGTGKFAQAFASTNGSGVVTSVTMIDAGQGYTAPTITVPGGGVLASVSANIATDAGLGDWDGVTNINRGRVQFEQVKAEHCIGSDGPFSGYSMMINDITNGAPRGISIHNYTFSRQVNSSTPGCPVVTNNTGYARLLFNAGFGNKAVFDDFPGYDGTTNPAQGSFTDVSVIRNIFSQGITLIYPTFSSNSDDVHKYLVDENGNQSYGGFRQATFGFTGDGQALATGYVGKSTFAGANLVSGYFANEANARFKITMDGTHSWGPGGSTALDTFLSRGAINRLTTPGYFYAKALQVNGPIPGGLSNGIAQIGADPAAGTQIDGTGSTNDVTIYNSSNAHTAFAVPHGKDGVQLGQSTNSTITQLDMKLAVTGCTTPAAIGSVCATPITVTWNTAFADSTYFVSCTPVGAPTGLPSSIYVVSKSTTNVVVNYWATSAVAASWPALDCKATHT